MRNVLKYAGIGLLVVGLAGCDGNNQNDNAAGGNQDGKNSQNGQNIVLMDGRLTFTLPADMSDQSGKLGTRSNNMHVYADSTGQKAVIVIEDDATRENLDVLATRLEQQQRNRDPHLQVIANNAVDLHGQIAQRLDTVTSIKNQAAWSSVILAKSQDKHLTLQISLPADNPQQSHSEADRIVRTIALK